MRLGKGVLIYVLAALCTSVLNPDAKAADRMVTDMVGRDVALREQTERIITTFKPAALCVLSLGLSDHLVGIDTHSKHDRLQVSVCPRIADLPGVGRKSTGLNLETIVNLKPDLVLLYAQKDGIKIADRLVSLGIPALVILPETFQGLQKTLGLIAEAAGRPTCTGPAFCETERVLSLVGRRVGDMPPGERKTVYYASSMGMLSTATGSLLQDEIIRKAGGNHAGHALTGYFKEISPEQFIKWNPDVVVFSCAGRKNVASVTARPHFEQVRAVADGQLYVFPSDLAPWDFPSPLSTLGVLWLADKLYPERFADVDMPEETDRFHYALFKKRFSEMGGRLKDRPLAP